MKILRIFLILVVLALGVLSYWAYKSIWGANVKEELVSDYFFIKNDQNFNSVTHHLYADGFIKDTLSFIWVAKLMKYGDNAVKPGKYFIESGWSNRDLLSILRSGEQETVKLTFNQIRTVEELAGVIAQSIEADSSEILTELNGLAEKEDSGIDYDNRLALFIPNTYEFYWSTKARAFIARMQKEYNRFWKNEKREAQLKNLGLNPNEVYTLASIVEKETIFNDEKPRVAGVYLNRLKRGIRLQADPTVVFASGDFGIRRVLNKHLEIESPYNTYQNDGLPPGPIFMPDVSTIDAVLNAEDHDFIFFCAKPGYNGRHAFAKTLAGHNRNAAEYRMWLNREKIK